MIPKDLETEVPEIVAWAHGLSITTPDAFADAGERLKQIKGMATRVAAFFKPAKQQADAAKKAILDMERQLADPLANAEQLCKRKMITFQEEENRKAEAERRRLQAEVDEQARRDREKAEQEATRQRAIEAEQRQQAEDARRRAEEADGAEKRRLQAEADAAERRANAAAVKVEIKTDQAAAAVAPVVAVAVAAPRVAGVSTKTVWKFRVVDKALVPDVYKVIDEQKLGAYARAMKEGASVPGVQFYTEAAMSARGN